ncbi:recombinase family protein [Amnibacterium kyonggiense]|uniref:DNA invertase Pin-like site-specific DNA recombinase n=1 Tax=Amnibacterium kyonggiense TaxID=595671 RepID=A0A4R7FEU3_9MICO|nr:recombinase family protein [Amnibacterium kyonggiense]TDS74513.1 DNA invertase Pin-like site-specific DNA recombinase [Amnibacterium kyonggiense]
MSVPTTGHVVAYARVSTQDQDEQLQIDAFKAAGVHKSAIYIDHGVSGKQTSRPMLDKMLDDLEPGDKILVWDLTRLGRNSGHVITLLADLKERGIYVQSLQDGLDSTTDMGEAMMGVLAIFAAMERKFTIRRTRAGLAVARAEGRVGGRPRALNSEQAQLARHMKEQGKSVAVIAATLKCSVPTVYRHLAAQGA